MCATHDREYSTLILWSLTFLGASLEVYFLVSQIYSNVVQLDTQAFSLPLIQDLEGLAVIVFLPLIWCGFWSHRLRRLVSPINVQILTMGIVAIILTYYLATTITSPYGYPIPAFRRVSLVTFLSGSTIIWGFAFVFIVGIGVMQTLLIRWWNGLNFDEELEPVSYVINAESKTVLKSLDESLCYTWGLREKTPGTEDVTIFVRRNPRDRQILVIGLGDDQSEKGKSFVAAVAYDTSFYDLTNSDKADAFRDSFMRDFKSKVIEENSQITFSAMPKSKDPVTTAAYNYAVRPTRSKGRTIWQVWRGLPMYHKYVFATMTTALTFTILAMIVAVELPVNNFPFDNVLIIAVTFFVAIVIDVGFSLREELARPKKRKR